MDVSVYDQVREFVLRNVLGPGEPLTETALAERLGVSRTPIREALKRLEQDGLVERHGRGVRVRVRSPEEILEIYEVRVALEAAAARGAALRRTDLDLSRLRAIHTEMLALSESQQDERVTWNTRFHEALRRASHNATLEEFMVRLVSQVSRYPQTTLSYPGRWDLILREHEEMISAIADRDADRAGSIAAEHMTTARDTRLRMFAVEENDSDVFARSAQND